MGDAFGFMQSTGGYQSFKGPIGLGLPNPKDFVDKVLDPEMMERLEQQVRSAQSLLTDYQDKMMAIKTRWLTESPAQELLDASAEKKKKAEEKANAKAAKTKAAADKAASK